MKQTVVLSIRGRQTYADQEPEVIELVTEGTMAFRDGGWDITYEESELTGLAGVTTTFRVEPGKVILTRTGALNSQMIFQEGVAHDSLYQMAFGALMLTVKATFVYFDIVPDGGVIDLSYNIDIENTEAGVIDYHLDIRAK
ncbi:MAG: DUF1934 domain-containing protein [Oscillospiraceae bacterium]|jgi:uncharacterized beta-barrel protein YwiB (DUF1934 family)|nr:DUF1934 domain-containing protein [Oscillospiraceae bacterium]